MTILIDPEESERRTLLEFTGDLAGRRILEIGSGNGRLTWRFAHLAGSVVAIEPNADKFSLALQDFPSHLKDKVEFHQLNLEEYAASPSARRFDLAILSWSL
jgi:tRNA A58 N-methylase Trm61